MTTAQIRGTPEVVTIRWIPKYTGLERVMHWVHVATFFPLVTTGLVLFTPLLTPLAQGEGGQLLRLIHRVAAVAFIVVPFIYVILEPRRTLLHFREFAFDREDIGWVKGAIGYYLFGRHADMPPQGRFNSGEKINGLVTFFCWVVFVGTGLLMWFGKGIIPTPLFQWAVLLHDLGLIAILCMFAVHLFLAVGHPLMWAALVSMRFGVTSAEYAAQHHAKWFYGPKRAMEMWEAHRQASHAPPIPRPPSGNGESEPAGPGQASAKE